MWTVFTDLHRTTCLFALVIHQLREPDEKLIKPSGDDKDLALENKTTLPLNMKQSCTWQNSGQLMLHLKEISVKNISRTVGR